MTTDPRRAWVDVLARMGRETQLHLDERYRHFRITDVVIIAVSLLLVILVVFNVYYVSVLYKDLDGIFGNMESMYVHLVNVDQDMGRITGQIKRFDQHMSHMDSISQSMLNLADVMPDIRGDMQAISVEMGAIRNDMGQLSQGMAVIDGSVQQMTGGVASMRANLSQISRPMGAMNPFLP